MLILPRIIVGRRRQAATLAMAHSMKTSTILQQVKRTRATMRLKAVQVQASGMFQERS
jgi:hypothetical protein